MNIFTFDLCSHIVPVSTTKESVLETVQNKANAGALLSSSILICFLKEHKVNPATFTCVGNAY